MQSEEVLLDRQSEEIDIEIWFDLVFDETKDAVLRYILVHIENPTYADDVFQEVYTNLYRRVSRKGIRDIRNPEAFLIRTAKREIVRHHRRERRIDKVLPKEMQPNQHAFGGVSPENTVVARDELHIIQQTIREMPSITCKVFVLHYYFELSLMSIAEELGTTTDAVKSRLSRARAAIRRRLEESR